MPPQGPGPVSPTVGGPRANNGCWSTEARQHLMHSHFLLLTAPDYSPVSRGRCGRAQEPSHSDGAGKPVCESCHKWRPHKGNLGMSPAPCLSCPLRCLVFSGCRRWPPRQPPCSPPSIPRPGEQRQPCARSFSQPPQLPATPPPALAGFLQHPRAAHSILWHSWGLGIPDSLGRPLASCPSSVGCLGWDAGSSHMHSSSSPHRRPHPRG